MKKVKSRALANFIFVICFYIFVQFSILIPAILFKIDLYKASNEMLSLLHLFQGVILLTIYSIIYRKSLKEDFDNFKDNKKEIFKKVFKYWVLGLGLMVLSNILISDLSPVKQANNEMGIRTLFKSSPIPMLLSIVIIAPFTEEILFRKSLRGIVNNRYIYTIVSGLLFGLAHVIGSYKVIYDLLFIFPYGLLGCALAMAYYETKNIWTSIFVHVLHNTFSIVIIIVSMLSGGL